MSNRLLWISVLVCALLGSQALAQVQVAAQVDQSKPIYAGSTFSYSVIVVNGEPEGVDLEPLKKYRPSNPSRGSRTSVVNGKTTGYSTLTYQMYAPAEGTYTIPSIEVTIDGDKYYTNEVSFTVTKPGETKQMDVELEFSAEKCYVGQPVIMTLSFYVWSDIVRGKQIRGLDINVPFLNDADFILENIDSDLPNTTPTALPVNGSEERTFQDQVRHDSVDCVRIRVVKAVIPQRDGVYELEPATVSADLAVSQKRRSRDGFFDDFFGSQYEFKRFSVSSEPVTLDVQPLPTQGKPADFNGLVGNYTITAEASPIEVNVGDPITLTIKVSGSKYLKPVQWPELESVPEIANNFKIPEERSDGEITAGVKVFTQTIRANNSKIKEIPAIPLSFFDAEKGEYRTVYSEPIPLDVSATRMVTGADVFGQTESKPTKQIKAIKEGLSANYTSMDALKNEKFSLGLAIVSPAFIVLWCLPFVVLIVSFIAKRTTANSPRRQIANKRKNAYSNAIKMLHKAEHAEKPALQVSLALKQYVADKFNKLPGSLTPAECGSILAESSSDPELSDTYRKLMERYEAAEYSPIAAEFNHENKKEITQLLKEIEKKVK